MNGMHDVGGMHGMGPIEYEKNEPVFHATWEGRVYALNRSLRAWRKWNLDTDRHTIELIPTLESLQLSYYERWARRLFENVVKYGFVTAEELTTGHPAPGSPKVTPALTAAMSERFLSRGTPSAADPTVRPRFKVGDRVRARNIHPVGHTRLPRYARGKIGTITIDHGVYSFPDTNAHGLGENRQHVYSVRFACRELWGESASARDSVYLDLWDDYLGRA